MAAGGALPWLRHWGMHAYAVLPTERRVDRCQVLVIRTHTLLSTCQARPGGMLSLAQGGGGWWGKHPPMAWGCTTPPLYRLLDLMLASSTA